MNNSLHHQDYCSIFASVIQSLIQEKRAMGLSYDAVVKALKEFDRFAFSRNHTELSLTKELIEAWATDNPNHKPRTTRHKMIIIRELARYMKRIGLPAFSSFEVPKAKYSYVPYIFTDDELKRLFEQADSYVPLTKGSNKHLVVPVFLRLLYYCGLRTSDVIGLLVKDVNLVNGTLHIRHGKFDRERFVPMSPSITEYCMAYMKAVHPNPQPEDVFLPNSKKQAFTNGGFYPTFRKLLWEAGISHGGSGQGPRVHDLRHTFAVHRLRDWVLDDVDMQVMLPYLAAYLGHTGLTETEAYLRLTPELFPAVTSRLEMEFGDIIPGAGGLPYAEK
jgi:integrase